MYTSTKHGVSHSVKQSLIKQQLLRLLGNFKDPFPGSSRSSSSHRRHRHNRLQFETMEPRHLLAAFVSTPATIDDVGIQEIQRTNDRSVGRIYADTNQDGVRQNFEPWLANWVVYGDNNGNQLLDPGESFATTNNGGWYGLQNLMPTSVVTPLLQVNNGISNNVTPESLVNSETQRVQIYSDVAAHPNGSIITWTSFRQDGQGWGVFAQRYDANGAKLGPEFQVNTTTKSAQYTPSVAAFDNGDFIITWMSSQTGTWNVYAQGFAANGDRIGTETMVNSSEWGNQMHPKVATLSNGNFVIAWQGHGRLNGQAKQGIWARIANSNGQPVSGEIPIAMTNYGGFDQFDLAKLPNGGFAVAHEGHADPDNRGIYLRTYNQVGRSLTPKFLVNQQLRRGRQWQPALATNNNGDLFVSYTSNVGDGSGKVVYLQKVKANMTLDHGPTRVNGQWLGTQWRSDVVAMPNGNVAVAWQGRGVSETDGVYIREFNPLLQPLAGEYRLSDTPHGMDRFVSIAGSTNGITAAWHGYGRPDQFGVYTRLMKGRPVMMQSISGIAFNDLNLNGIFDNLIAGDQPDVVFVIDVSGSTSGSFGGDPVGDLNNDGEDDTILDAEIAGFEALNDQLIALGFGDIADVSIVAYSSGSDILTPTPLKPNQDDDMNGIPDVKDRLRTLLDGGTTDYEAALQDVIQVLDNVSTTPENGNVIFLSDGFPNGGPFEDEAMVIRTKANNVRAFGVGTGASLTELQKIDPTAQIFTSTNELINLFGGIAVGGGSGGTTTEMGIAGVTVYIDDNDNGVLDAGERSQLTLVDNSATTGNELGTYRFDNLTPGTYVLRAIVPAGSTQTAPVGGKYTITLGPGQSLSGFNFGFVDTMTLPA